MSINRMLTAEPVKKSVNLRGGVRAVYDADGRPLCSVGKRRLYDLNGKPIAKYRKSETDSYEDVSLTERYYTDGKRLFLVSDGSLYLDGKWIGGVGPKRKSNIRRRAPCSSLSSFSRYSCVLFPTTVGFIPRLSSETITEAGARRRS